MSGFFGNTSGGFGSGGGFGASNTGGFGANNNTSTGGSIFGGANNTTATSGGFGSGGFGASAGGFGAAKPATGFGAPATSGGSAFGGNTTSTTGGFGGFGAQNTASTGFGSSNTTGGGIFGAKPATTFGGGTTGGNMFGGGASTTGGFGSNNAATTSSNPFASNNTVGFGASNTNTSTGFGASNTASTNSGTGSVPFQAWTEREPTGPVTSHYQSITFQEPYKNKSFEELRVEDYLQGRKFGSTNGQAGTFGASTGFGGSTFGAGNNTSAAPSGGLFGGGATNTATSGGFGGFGQQNNNTTTTSAFGSNTGGGLFGQNKPATGGLFGGGNTSSATTGGFGATTGSTGGIFGGGNTGGFGASNTNNTASTGTSLFGNNNNNTQNKPAFGGFGASTTTNNTGGFGANANSGSTGGLFGNNNASSNTGGGLFGGQNTSQPASNPFGGGATNNNSGGGLFGAKPAGTSLFGGSSNTGNTGGGLFGNNSNTNTQPQQGGGLFGSSTTNTGGGGLFGGNNNANQPKPSGGLFGSSTTGATGGTSLFGGNNNSTQPTGGSSLFGGNNNSGSSLFGGNNQNKPATGSLFGGGGGATNTSTNSLFGGNNQQTGQNSGGGLFGSLGQSNNNAQPNNNSMFGSSFGGQSNNNQNQQNQLHANLTVSPYGNDQLFSSLATASTPVGPLATPLAGARPTPSKTQSLLSSTRLNSPIYTPRASAVGRNPGYGFSYSTYGTPGSAYSVSVTPQASSLLKPTGSLGSALTSRLAKSMSMSNLRAGDSTPREGESLLRPTPGSASSRYLASGNMRKLTIDRSLRHELFSPPTEQRQPEHKQLEAARENDAPALGKKVSFDEHSKQSNAEPSATNALVRTETEEEDSPSNLFRASEKTPVNGTPEMSQVNGNLHTVFEDGEQRRPASAPGIRPGEADLSKEEVGDYWTKPSIKDLKNMGRETLKKLGGIVVGRHGVGRIEFSACDLSNTDLDDICGQDNGKGIVHLKPRSATVYPNEATKPARGKGLNVPSKIFLENSWPKSHGGKKAVMANSGPAYEKHIRRLKKTGGTKFLDYDVKTGTWSFSVEHFTTYELDDSDDDETTMDMNDQQDSSGLSDAPATPGQDDDTMQSIETGETGTGEVDDTFEFKINQRSLSSAAGAHPPGAFDESHVSYDYDDPSADEDVNEDFMMSGGLGNAEEDPFASPGGAVQPPSPQTYERYHSSMIDEHSGAVQLAEEMQNDPEPELPGSFMPEEPKLLRSILKPTARASAFASPQKLATETWEDQLQRTMSPQKRDRQYLREIQKSAKVMNERQEDFADTPFKRSMLGRSALGQSYLAQKSAKKVGFGASTMQIQPADMGKSQAFRTSMDIMNSLWSQEKSGKNGFATERSYENPYPKRTRLSTADDMSSQDAAFHETMKPSFASNGMLVHSVEGSTPQVSEPLATGLQPIVGEHKEVRFAKWLPAADINTRTLTAQKELTSIDLASGFPHANTSAAAAFVGNAAISADKHEQAVWSLAGHLFDAVELLMEINDMTAEQVAEFEPRLRKDAFSALWASLVQEGLDEQLALARSPEERALLYLTKNDVPAACDALAAGKDFKLATLIAQLPGTEGSRQLMQTQITAWKDRNDWAEFSDATRALYSILAGEVCTVSGKNSTAENRAKEFCNAEKFGLSWVQSLALRTFFAGHEKPGDAFKAYFAALTDGEEHVLPLPSWAANDDAADRESVLVGLLRLSTSRNNAFDPSPVFDPKTVSGSAVNSRLAWQLATQIRAKGLCSAFTDEKMDQLTLSFATELEAAGKFLTATWVLLHLRNGESRTRAVTALLFRNGGNIPEAGATPEGTIDAFHVLNAENQIPADILWSAKAQHARAELDNAWLQCEYLLQASALDEAHDVVCTTLGPKAVIEEEYGPLKDLLDRFPAEPEGWSIGGNVFRDFASLVTMSVGKKYGFEGADVMVRLRDGLEGMSRSERTLGLEERVAIVEMGRVLQKEIGELAIRPGGIEVRGADVRMVDDGPADVGVGAFLRYKEAMGVVA